MKGRAPIIWKLSRILESGYQEDFRHQGRGWWNVVRKKTFDSIEVTWQQVKVMWELYLDRENLAVSRPVIIPYMVINLLVFFMNDSTLPYMI